MAEIHLCDLCESVLTDNSYALAIAHKNELITNIGLDYSEINDLAALEDRSFQRPYNYKPKCQTLEICDNCYKVLNNFLKLRKNEVLKLHKKIKKVEKNLEIEGEQNVRG